MSTEYKSFLIRLWRQDTPDAHDIVADWRGEVEYIQSGQRYHFDTLDETLDFVRRQASTAETLPVDDTDPGLESA